MRGRGGGKKEGSNEAIQKLVFSYSRIFIFFVVLRFLAIFKYRSRFRTIVSQTDHSICWVESKNRVDLSASSLSHLTCFSFTRYNYKHGSYSSSTISSPDRTRYVPLSSLFISHLSPSSSPSRSPLTIRVSPSYR